MGYRTEIARIKRRKEKKAERERRKEEGPD